MLAMEEADKERKQVTSGQTYTTQDHFSKNSPPHVGNGENRQGEKQVTSGQTYTHAQHKTIQ